MADKQELSLKKGLAMPQQQKEGASTRSIVALILGLTGMFFFQPVGIAAWIIGSREKEAIAKGKSSQAGMNLAKAGWILGIIDTFLFALSIIAVIIILLLAFKGSWVNQQFFHSL